MDTRLVITCILVLLMLIIGVIIVSYKIMPQSKILKQKLIVINQKLKISNYKCFFNDLSQLYCLNVYVYDVLVKWCKSNGIFFFEISDKIMNKGIDESHKSAGRYTYIKNKTICEMHSYTNSYIEDKIEKEIEIDDKIEYYLPNITINSSIKEFENKESWRVVAHEIGHHFININGEKQSEKLADFYILQVIKDNLPKCFMSIYRLSLTHYSNLDSTDIVDDLDFEIKYENYLHFRQEHPEMNLPLKDF